MGIDVARIRRKTSWLEAFVVSYAFIKVAGYILPLSEKQWHLGETFITWLAR